MPATKRFTCNQCNEKFPSKVKLEEHKKHHNPEKSNRSTRAIERSKKAQIQPQRGRPKKFNKSELPQISNKISPKGKRAASQALKVKTENALGKTRSSQVSKKTSPIAKLSDAQIRRGRPPRSKALQSIPIDKPGPAQSASKLNLVTKLRSVRTSQAINNRAIEEDKPEILEITDKTITTSILETSQGVNKSSVLPSAHKLNLIDKLRDAKSCSDELVNEPRTSEASSSTEEPKTKDQQTSTDNIGNDCLVCNRTFSTPRGLKKHLSFCNANLNTNQQQIKTTEVLPAIKQTRSIAVEAKETTLESSSLHTQLRGKINTTLMADKVNTVVNDADEINSSTDLADIDDGEGNEDVDQEINEAEMQSDAKATHKCDKCTAVFKLKSSVDRHKKVLHMEGQSHTCDVCGARCADKGTLARHQYTHTGIKPFHCESCKRQFSRKYHLVRHLIETKCGGNDEGSVPCQICSKVFSRKSNLREHMRVHDSETQVKSFKCEFCPKDFHTYSLLSIHVRTHTGEKPFQCDHCPKTFPSNGAAKKHQRIHTGERPYCCEICNAKFALKGTLNRHMRTHTGVRPHTCPYCGKQFIQSGGLKAHLFHHTGENGFRCDLCNKTFNRKARLQMHVKYIHEKDKPYACDVCNKRFVRKEDLTRHAVLHTGIKPFTCPSCPKSFAIKPSLKLHLLTHTKEEPHACHECGRAFIRQDCLLRHMRKRHREMLDKIVTGYRLPSLNTIIAAAEEPTSPNILDEAQLASSIRELLSLLVDEPTLQGFGWPEKPVDQILEAVIKRCGHTPVNPERYPYMDRLRENSKLLFTVVIDDNAVRTLLNNQTVDEVILHVLRLAQS